MAYYGALVPVVQLLEDISNDDRVQYPDFDLGKHPITKSLHEKFTLLQTLLDDNSSSNGDGVTDDLERRIRDVSYWAQDIIESHISENKTHILKNIIIPQCDLPQVHGLKRVEEKIGSILDELAMIKESNIKVEDFVDIGNVSKDDPARSESGMAYYGVLVAVVQLLGDIRHDHVRYPDSDLAKQPIIKSLHEKFTLMQNLLEDIWLKRSSNLNFGEAKQNGDHEVSDDLEREIKDVSYRAKNRVENYIINPQEAYGLHRVDEEADSILDELARIRNWYIIRPQPLPQEEDFPAPPSPSPAGSTTMVGFDEHVITIKEKLCGGPSQLQTIPQHEGLKRVEEEVDSILDKLKRIKESYIKVVEDVGAGSSSSKSDQVDIGSSTMVGFDEHVIAIKKKLCGGSSQLQTIPITGMGGIGKTTLARNIFDDKLIVEYFDICIWVTVSQDYNKEKMLRDILDFIKAESSRGLSVTELLVKIHHQLMNRRYLIIVDDIWSTNVLDDINRISPDNSNGSRVIITTRLSDVANYGKTSKFVHQMQSLNEEQSWDLLRKKVFAQEEGCVCPPELEDLGKSIARKCRGLPLAIVVIAGVLSKVKRTQTGWNEIASNVNSVVAENDEHFSRIFSLSYSHLPHHLKPCFLYIGGFPEDHKIQASNLIKLWMAEGFLNNNNNNRVLIEESSKRRRRSLEEVGEEYLEDLVKRNLILVTAKKIYSEKIEVCGIHDLLRDLCQERCRNENFFHFIDENGKIPKDEDKGNNVRRACLYPNSNSLPLKGLIRKSVPGSTTRSILCFGKHAEWGYMNISLGCFKLLRVFEALEIEFESFPDKLLELFHLRYLALFMRPKSSTEKDIIRISPLISQLQNLQTFIVQSYSATFWLPSEMWKMAQLRHVMIIPGRLKMSPPPVEVGLLPLENLQTLEELRDFTLTEEVVAMFPNLKILKVQYTKRVGNWKWEYINNLSNLRQLEELQIFCLWNPGYFPKTGFAFPPNLKKLTVTECRIPWERMGSVMGCLPNLEQLKLHNSTEGNEWEPKEGDFQSLKYLDIFISDLKDWRADEKHFPRLVHLQLYRCSKLEEIPLEIGDIPTLQFIEVLFCSDSATESARLIQQQQKDMGNDTLQFRIVSDVV